MLIVKISGEPINKITMDENLVVTIHLSRANKIQSILDCLGSKNDRKFDSAAKTITITFAGNKPLESTTDLAKKLFDAEYVNTAEYREIIQAVSNCLATRNVLVREEAKEIFNTHSPFFVNLGAHFRDTTTDSFSNLKDALDTLIALSIDQSSLEAVGVRLLYILLAPSAIDQLMSSLNANDDSAVVADPRAQAYLQCFEKIMQHLADTDPQAAAMIPGLKAKHENENQALRDKNKAELLEKTAKIQALKKDLVAFVERYEAKMIPIIEKELNRCTKQFNELYANYLAAKKSEKETTKRTQSADARTQSATTSTTVVRAESSGATYPYPTRKK